MGLPAVLEVRAVFFDLFGTLLSLAPLADACERLVPGRGPEVAARWRARQLEASWLRTAMEEWVDFDVVTRDALLATLSDFESPPPEDVDTVADAFAEMPVVDGAEEGIRALSGAGLTTGILSNASARTLARAGARLGLPFDHLVSVDRARRFKPHPSVYRLAVEATGLRPGEIGFVTSNGWDAAGAGSFGFQVAWLRPDPSATLPAVGPPPRVLATWPEIPRIFVTEQR
jgi:2-haloacid dehalogenase